LALGIREQLLRTGRDAELSVGILAPYGLAFGLAVEGFLLGGFFAFILFDDRRGDGARGSYLGQRLANAFVDDDIRKEMGVLYRTIHAGVLRGVGFVGLTVDAEVLATVVAFLAGLGLGGHREIEVALTAHVQWSGFSAGVLVAFTGEEVAVVVVLAVELMQEAGMTQYFRVWRRCARPEKRDAAVAADLGVSDFLFFGQCREEFVGGNLASVILLA